MQHYTCDNTDRILYKIPKDNASNAYGIYNYKHSNSGIPSTKANPISRMFPPLFTIKISEEEKIAEDLHKIKSMQLIVQIIMIIVCIYIYIYIYIYIIYSCI